MLSFTGEITSKKDFNKCLTLIVSNKKKTEQFKAFDLPRIIGMDYSISDVVNIQYITTETEKGTYNKIITIKLEQEKPQILILEGIITNTNNSRETNKEYTCFCFKSKFGKKVDYCIANKIIENSIWFKKGSKVKLEVIYEERKLDSDKWFKHNHRTLKVINMWGID